MPPEDPCVRADRLRSVREALITGRAVIETRFDDKTVRYGQADRGALDREIAAADEACALATGGVAPKRRRFAMGVRFRSY